MLHDYADIIKATGGKNPKWWDENGVPRFGKHHPKESADIYAKEVALVEIRCQNCPKKFLVQMTWSYMDDIRYARAAGPMSKRVDSLHYGDPPRHEDPAGNTMNCYDLRVVEFWAQKDYEWVRVPELEKALPDILEAAIE